MIVGLNAPTAGQVTVHGKHYAAHRAPLREIAYESGSSAPE